SLGNPLTAIDVADSALKYVKADQNLSRDDVNTLIRAFRNVNANDSTSVEFTTLPVDPDPNNPSATLVPSAQAPAVDQALRTCGNAPAPSPVVPPAQVKVTVLDGTGTSDVATAAKLLTEQGFAVLGTGRAAKNAPVTQVLYGKGTEEAARTLLDYVPDAA